MSEMRQVVSDVECNNQFTRSEGSGILLLTASSVGGASGGRFLLSKLNHDILKDVFGARCLVVEIQKNRAGRKNSIFSAFRGHIDGLSNEFLASLVQDIEVGRVSKVFVDGSNYGEIVRTVKKSFSGIEVYTFFHNVEAKFFLDSLRQTKTLRALAVLIVNYLAERKAVQFSDEIVCLNQRDSCLLKRVYGKPATHISPMAMHDKLPGECVYSTGSQNEKYVLFVGGAFYANRAGIAWFVKYVSPHISCKTYIVGKGFECLKKELETHENVKVIGEVSSLAQWYRDAHLVVAPIFSGSGMKTKVAEALMFGKKVIGTPEAFTGYEDVAEEVGCICSNAKEFVRAIESSDTYVEAPFDRKLREIYESKYSYAAAKLTLEGIVG